MQSLILNLILSYLVNLASNERTAAMHDDFERKLANALDKREKDKEALASGRSLRDEIAIICNELACRYGYIDITPGEKPVWRLLNDAIFQADLTNWLMIGGIDEGREIKGRLLSQIEMAMADGGATQRQIDFFKTDYFDALEKAIFAHPILAQWRHQQSLDYLREQVLIVRRYAESAAGIYSPTVQEAALNQYCEKALAAWDIIDLTNLPEDDLHLVTQKILLRQLYMPLRVTIEKANSEDGYETFLDKVEEKRESLRQREAGHLWLDELEENSQTEFRTPVGDRISSHRRLVILGDPGSGKTTMLRWMATAYLLRYNDVNAFNQIPDTHTLPDRQWIPILIRCRDLGETDLCRCFSDFLTQHLYKTELQPSEAKVMQVVILDRIAKGEALLLVDGLDEITNAQVRMMFCQELERTATRYPDLHIVVTSRIVGYRDMPYRMRSGFIHGVISELNREDKDLFAKRWVDVTEQHLSAKERAMRTEELIEALCANISETLYPQ